MRHLTRLIAGLLLLSSPSAIFAEPAATGPFEYTTMVGSGEMADDGSVWFSSPWEDVRFVLAGGRNARGEDLWRIIKAAGDGKRELKVRFDPTAGSIDDKNKTMVFPICSVSLDQERFEANRKCGTRQPPRSPNSAQALLMGWALHQDGQNGESRKLLDRALAASDPSPVFRQIAAKARAYVLESIGNEEPPLSDESDRAYAAALADYRTLASLQPDVSDHLIDTSYQLEALGDYAGAIELLHQVMSKWPEEEYRGNIRLAAIERKRGNYDESLRLLNLVSAKHPIEPGMRFYFHRGWTLTKMQRYDEAISDFTEGLKDQPDYPWAYARRACAFGQVGQLKPALADVETAIGKIEADPSAKRQDFKHDLARLQEIDGLFKAAIAAGSTAPMKAACEGFWDREEMRTPSRYLPK